MIKERVKFIIIPQSQKDESSGLIDIKSAFLQDFFLIELCDSKGICARIEIHPAEWVLLLGNLMKTVPPRVKKTAQLPLTGDMLVFCAEVDNINLTVFDCVSRKPVHLNFDSNALRLLAQSVWDTFLEQVKRRFPNKRLIGLDLLS